MGWVVVMENLPSCGASPTAARWPPGELVALSPAPTRVRAELLSPPRADRWVSDELFHSASIIFPLRHGGDAAEGGDTLGYQRVASPSPALLCPQGLGVSLADAAC